MVTCYAGLSRSAATVLSYLVARKQMTGFDGLKQIRSHRDVCPSKEQLMYVAKLHNKVHGFDNIDVMDDTNIEMAEFRKIVIQKSKK